MLCPSSWKSESLPSRVEHGKGEAPPRGSVTFAAFGFAGLSFFFENCEVQFSFYRVDSVQEDSEAVSHFVNLARVLAYDFAGVFVVSVAIVDQRVQGDQAFYEQVGEFYEESEFGDAGDQGVEVFADAVLHEFHFFPFH